MPVAYTPGLRVTSDTVLRELRRLPLRGQVLVQVGDRVEAETVVARAEMPGGLHTVRVSQLLHLEPHELAPTMVKQVGDAVAKGDVLAQTQGLWGRFMKAEARSPVGGTLEDVNTISGHVRIREAPRRIDVLAHVAGEVVEVIEGQGAMIEARAALVQGIFGVGGEKRGVLRLVTASPSEPLRAETIADCPGCVLVAGAGADGEAIRRAAAAGATGLVVGAVSDEALRAYVGYEIGVAITGQEPVSMTLILTEGFGQLPMAQRTWELLASLEGQLASVNGATQIRAGVMRPEIVVTHQSAAGAPEPAPQQTLEVGVRVRVIREPHFGALGHVTGMPSELTEIETESKVRIAVVELDGGQVVSVPRANLELIQEMTRALPTRTSLPIIFAIAFATGFSGAVTPGSLLLVVVQKSVQFGWRAGPVLMIGHSLLELVAVVLLVTGLLAFARSRVARGVIGVVGGLVLVLLGYLSLGIDAHAVLRTMTTGGASAAGGLTAGAGLQLVGLGAVMSAINPYWWLWWATIGTAHVGWATQRGRGGGATYWVGHILADIVWYTALSTALGAGRTLLSESTLRGIYLVTAGFLALLGVLFAVSGVKALRAREEPGAVAESVAQAESV